MRSFELTKMDVKPNEVEGTIGVSDRLKDEDLKNAVEEQISSESKDNTEKIKEIEENKEEVESTLKEIVGSIGEYKIISRDELMPTPQEWNQFTPISRERKILMADSIYRIGLQHPIVVRRINLEKQYEILSGNTRNEIYGILYEITHDEKYLSIPAIVYEHGEISDDKAMEIASDTNYIQRGNLSSKDKAFAVRTKVAMLKKHGKKAVMDQVANQMGITRSSVFYWNKMYNLIPEILRMYEEGFIGLKTASRIASWSKEIQNDLFNYKDLISDDYIMKIKAKTPPEKVVEAFLAIVEGNLSDESKPLASIKSIKKKKSGCTIQINAPMKDDYDVLVMYIPKKKASKVRKSYEEYILEEIKKEEPVQILEESCKD